MTRSVYLLILYNAHPLIASRRLVERFLVDDLYPFTVKPIFKFVENCTVQDSELCMLVVRAVAFKTWELGNRDYLEAKLYSDNYYDAFWRRNYFHKCDDHNRTVPLLVVCVSCACLQP